MTSAGCAALPPSHDAYRPLTPQELGARITATRTEGGSLLRASRMSLAGPQDKLAVRFAAPFADQLASPKGPLVQPAEAMLEPEDQASTTHILKPEPPLARRLQHVWLDTAPAMTIGGCIDEDHIQPEHFKAFHAECLAPHGVKVQAVRAQLKKLGGTISAQARKLDAQLAPAVGDDNATFLRGEVLPVIERRAQLALEAAAGLAPAPAVRRPARG